jgi:two-component system CheB/CheR fusion protein
VGIGASAGGLEALRRMLAALPADSAAAFVLIQHLAPDRESALAEILSRSTPMPVSEVSDEPEVRPNHVYVIPPDRNMILSRGRLRLVPRQARGLNLPIDLFFRSLAQTQGHRAVGVVLSGTANDGTLGLEAIKAEGGITFAQDDSAQQSGMPQSAVASGCVDFVLPPEGIAREIAHIAEHPYVRATAGAARLDSAAEKERLAPVLDLLWDTAGVDFRSYKANSLSRRIRRRMVLQKVERVEDYASYLRDKPAELEALYRDILISVTSFFRDPELFQALQDKVIPALLQGRSADDPLRVWVLGCSTGEEAYSLAMVLAECTEPLRGRARAQIFATDLSPEGIAHARAGIYSAERMHQVSRERQRRFFLEREGRFQVSKSIRDMCVFATHNALADPPFSRMDLVSCRNLLIYLEPSLQRRVIPMLHYALRPTGFLILGSSETVGQHRDLFSVGDAKHRIFAKKPGTGQPSFLLAQRTASDPRADGGQQRLRRARQPEAAGGADVHKEAERLLLDRFSPPAVLLNADLEILRFLGSTEPFLVPPQGKATFSLLRMIRQDLLAPLRALLKKAKSGMVPVAKDGLRLPDHDAEREITLEVIPVASKGAGEGCWLVLFRDRSFVQQAPPAGARRTHARSKAEDSLARIAELECELDSAREYARALIEQHDAASAELQSANEEAQSGNEELQSINEELETTKEEIQSGNEELTTVNDELNHRNLEISQLNGDLTNLIDSLHVAIVMVDRDLRIRRSSPAAAKVLGILSGDTGRSISDLSGKLLLTDLEWLLNQVIDTVSPLEREVQARNGNWYSLRLRPYRSPENRIDGAVLMLVDINELRRAREHSAGIIETVREPLLVLDDDLRVTFANRAFHQAFGPALGETVGLQLYRLGGGQWDIPKLRQLLAGIVEEGSSVQDFVMVADFKAIGEKRLVLNARRLPISDEGRPEILLAIHDDTERARSEESRARLAAIVDASDDAIVSMTLDGMVMSWNPGAERLFGYRAEEIIGRSIASLIPADRQGEEAEVLKRVREGEHVPALETVRRAKDGRSVEISLSVAPVVGANGRVAGISSIGRDISHRRHLEQQLRERIDGLNEIDREKNNFLAVLTHELRSPLNAVYGWVQVLQSQGASASVVSQGLAAIERNCKTQVALMADLMDIHRISSGKLSLDAVEIDLNAVVQAALETVLPSAAEKQIRIRSESELTPATLFGDPNRLQQVFWNLLANAIKFTPPGGEIHIALKASGPLVEISVQDTGIGIAAETMPYLFQRFRQVDAAANRSHGGLGLGLAIAKQLVELHAGTIGAWSAGRDKGARFTILLPLRSAEYLQAPRALIQESGHPPTTSLSGIKVLVVDDQADAREPLRAALEGAGAEVITAGSAAEALEALRDQRPDVVVSDVGMPAMDGYELVRSIRSLPLDRGRGIPAIALTAFASPQDREQALRAGFNVHLAKPAETIELLGAVSMLVSPKQRRDNGNPGQSSSDAALPSLLQVSAGKLLPDADAVSPP